MQPNLQQDEKFNYAARQEVMKRYIALSDRSTGPQSTGVRDVTHLIWPESAFPFFLTREAEALAQIADLLPQGTVLITGAVRAPEPAPGAPMSHAYNSIYVIDHDGSMLSVYDKVHLVPFGEYLPFQDLLERLGLMQLTKVHGGFIPGDRRRAIEVPRAPRFLPLICYEIIFPGEAVPRGERPGWLRQPHQRRLVRHQQRAVSASPTGARARDRRRLAAGARRQYRHLGGDRSARPRHQVAAARHRRRAGFSRCRVRSDATIYVRAGDGAAGLADRRGVHHRHPPPHAADLIVADAKISPHRNWYARIVTSSKPIAIRAEFVMRKSLQLRTLWQTRNMSA